MLLVERYRRFRACHAAERAGSAGYLWR